MAAETITAQEPGLGATLRSEWTKLRSLRSTSVVLALTLVVGVGLSALGTIGVADTLAEQGDIDQVGYSLFGMNFALILFAVLGATGITSEYATGMIRLTLTVTPRRGRLLIAKLGVLAVTAWITGFVTALASFLVGQAVLSQAADVPALGLGDEGAFASVLNWGTEAAGFTVIACTLGVLLRSAAGAIATVLGLLFGPLALGSILPDWFTEYVERFMPANAGEHLTAHQPDPSAATYLDPGLASAVFSAWVLGFALLAAQILRRRDVR